MEPLLVFPDPAPAVVAQALGLASYTWKAVGSLDEAEDAEPEDGWSGGVICADELPDAAFGLCRSLRKRDVPFAPLLLLLSPQQLGPSSCAKTCSTTSARPLVTRGNWKPGYRTCSGAPGAGLRPELVEYGPLVLNLETYQASVAGKPLSLTFMEYELLKFLATHPGKVFTRETLLSRVWGYEYYGGARTVDVHIRRLRAKLGEEHANLISTVRSVGYRFGQSRWAL